MSSEHIRRRLDVLGARKLYIAAAAASAGLIAAALFMQHVVGLNPCPLCILQRVAYLLLALAAALAAWRPPRPAGRGLGFAALVMALVGAGVAAWHVRLKNCKKGVAVEDAGAVVIHVAREGDKKEIPPLILVKSDGGVMYGTTDLATIIDRRDTAHPDRILYVVDGRQRDHFEQVFRASDIAGVYPKDRREHLWFGTMNGKDGKPFKTRSGGVLKLRDLIQQVTDAAFQRMLENKMILAADMREAEPIGRAIGVGALKFADLSNPRTID